MILNLILLGIAATNPLQITVEEESSNMIDIADTVIVGGVKIDMAEILGKELKVTDIINNSIIMSYDGTNAYLKALDPWFDE